MENGGVDQHQGSVARTARPRRPPAPAPRSSSPVPRLRPYQAEVFRAVLASARAGHGRSFSVMISRQGGKNEMSALLELVLLLQHLDREVDGVKCAPTFRPQGRISLRRLWSRVQALRLGPVARLEGGNAVRVGRARQLFLSAEPGASVVGHTCHLLLECDEAQDVAAEKFDKDFRPMAATTNATTVYYGTAWTETDLLAEMRRRHLEMERRDGIRRHFEFDWEVVARHNPAYAAFVAEERARLGEDHPLFVTQYLLHPLSGGGRLLSHAQRELLHGTHPRLAAPPAEREASVLGYVAGLDVGGEAIPLRSEGRGAGSGSRSKPQSASRSPQSHDFTVLTIARVVATSPGSPVQEPAIEVVEHAAWQGAPHAELAGGLARLLRQVWPVRRVVVDATGVGEGLASTLASMRPGPTVLRLRLTEERKSALGYGLLAAVNSGRLRLYRRDGSPECTALWRELELARAEYRQGRRLAWFVDPADGHDDFLMSLALAVEAARDLHPRTARGRTDDCGPRIEYGGRLAQSSERREA
jgi:hypothetical protein